MAKRVEFQWSAGTAQGEVVEPKGNEKVPAVVLIQEYWGVNDHIRSLLDRLAAAGFLAIAPDLYDGKITKSADEAGALMNSLDWPKAVGYIDGAAKWALAQPRCNGKVGVMGFCLGGALTIASSTQSKVFSAAVSFYGMPPFDKTHWENISAPLQAHVATHDQWVTVESANRVKDKLTSLGKSVEMHTYDANHAFVNDTRPEVHDPVAAKQAWDRATAFLHAHVG